MYPGAFGRHLIPGILKFYAKAAAPPRGRANVVKAALKRG
jgi:hypothetical protein